MSHELERSGGAVERREERAVERQPSMHDVFVSMAKDATIDPARIGALMDLQIKAEDRWAEKEFNAAFARLVPQMPRLVKRGNIPKNGGNIKFCTIEDMDAQIRPLYTAEGFTLSFYSKPTTDGIIRVAKLRHVAGHSETSEMQLPPDTGPGRNQVQSLGSSMSYADRYLTRGVFNLIMIGEDNDGNGAPVKPIDKVQIKALGDLMHEMSFTEKQTEQFYLFMGSTVGNPIKALSDISKPQYPQAFNYLNMMRRKLNG